jgi:hypothetical protein
VHPALFRLLVLPYVWALPNYRARLASDKMIINHIQNPFFE